MPKTGTAAKLGAAPFGVTVVEEPSLVASCVTVEGSAPSADVRRKQIHGQPRFAMRSHRGHHLPTNEAPHVEERSEDTELGMRSPKFWETMLNAPLTQSVQVRFVGMLGIAPPPMMPVAIDSMLETESAPVYGSMLFRASVTQSVLLLLVLRMGDPRVR